MATLRVLVGIVLIGASLSVLAAPETQRLICAYSYTIDADGKMAPTTGEDLFTVVRSKDGHALIRKQDLGAPFSGLVSDEEVRGDTEYQVGGYTYQQSLAINRFTGAFTLTFKTPTAAGLVHHGTCRPAEKPLF